MLCCFKRRRQPSEVSLDKIVKLPDVSTPDNSSEFDDKPNPREIIKAHINKGIPIKSKYIDIVVTTECGKYEINLNYWFRTAPSINSIAYNYSIGFSFHMFGNSSPKYVIEKIHEINPLKISQSHGRIKHTVNLKSGDHVIRVYHKATGKKIETGAEPDAEPEELHSATEDGIPLIHYSTYEILLLMVDKN